MYNEAMNDTVLSEIDTDLGQAIAAAAAALFKQQREDGHWVFELEADATIPSEYVLLTHYLGETPNLELETQESARI